MKYRSVAKRVLEDIEDRRDEIVQFLKDMVRIPSPFGEEAQIQTLIAAKLKTMGLKVDVWEPDVAEVMKHLDLSIPLEEGRFKGRPVVVGTAKGKGGGRSLILQGHVDVEPPGNGEWAFDPWSGTIEGDRLYGRGANDMKGGMAAMIMALDSVLKAEVRLKGDVVVESVIEEEISGAGAVACVASGYRADAAIIPEFTGCQIGVATEGVMTADIKVKGRAAHAAISNEGVSAIDKAWLIHQAITELEAYREQKASHPAYDRSRVSPFIPLKVTMMRAGVGKIIPGEATLQCRIGFLPNEDPDDVFNEFKHYIMEAAERDPWMKEHPPEIQRVGNPLLAAEIDPNHPIVESLKRSYQLVARAEPVVTGFAFVADNRILIKQANIPTVLFGPGGAGAHGPNEYVSLDDVIIVTKSIALTLLDWCDF